MADEEGALVVGDGDDQGAAQADHQVGHGQAEDEHVHGLQQRRVLEHDADHQAVVEHRQHRVDEHEEGEDAVAQPGEDGGRYGGRRAPRRAVAVHCCLNEVQLG